MAGDPRFQDGNVDIRLSEKDTYILHKSWLEIHSPWFKAVLSRQWNRSTTDTPLDGEKKYWIYELRFDKENPFVGTLMKKDAKMPADTICLSKTDVEVDLRLSTRRHHVLNAHRIVINALYHVPSVFTESSFYDAVRSIIELAAVAEMYGCEGVTEPRVETYLHSHRSEVSDL